MKKFLSVMSLVLVFVMVAATFAVGVFAETPEVITNEDGTKTYTVSGYKAATPDGSVGADEYSVKADLAMSGKSDDMRFSQLRASDYSETELSCVSESVSMSFSHSSEKIYIGVIDKSGPAVIRN